MHRADVGRENANDDCELLSKLAHQVTWGSIERRFECRNCRSRENALEGGSVPAPDARRLIQCLVAYCRIDERSDCPTPEKVLRSGGTVITPQVA